MRLSRCSLGYIAGLTVLPLALIAVLPASATERAIFYKARAYGAYGQITAAGAQYQARLADTFEIGCSGEPRDATLASATNPQPLGINAKGLRSHVIGQGLTSAADAAAEDVTINVPGLKIRTTTLDSHAEATCKSDGTVTLTAGSNVQTLTINDRTIAITGGRNQKIEVPDVATVYVNHQSKKSDEIRVSALRVVLANESYPVNGDLFVAHSKAGMYCKP